MSSQGSRALELKSQGSGKRKRESGSKHSSSPDYVHTDTASVPDKTDREQSAPHGGVNDASNGSVARKLMFQSGDGGEPTKSKRSRVVSESDTPGFEQEQESSHLDCSNRAVQAAAEDEDRDGRKDSAAVEVTGKRKRRKAEREQKRANIQDANQAAAEETGRPELGNCRDQPTAEPAKLGSKTAGKKKRRKESVSEAGQEENNASSGTEAAEIPSQVNSQTRGGILKVSKGKSRKKVTFDVPAEPTPASEDAQVEVIPRDARVQGSEESQDETDFTRVKGWVKDNQRKDLITGKFSKQEDELLKQSVFDYIQAHGWSQEEGLEKLMSGRSSKECSGCWFEIGNCLPRRSIKALYSRAHRLLDQGNHLGRWTPEEEESLIRLHTEHGPNWAKIAKLLGRYAYNAKDKWRDLKLKGTRQTGRLQQGELEKVSAMVHKCIREKILFRKEDDRVDRRNIRDDINWDAIADALGTRSHSVYCKAWYVTLASSMVAEGLWANTDDFLLLERLLECGASADDAVDWENLLEHREGHVCKRRWEQMAKHLGPHRLRPFEERLHMLVKRYAPHLLDSEEGNGPSHEG